MANKQGKMQNLVNYRMRVILNDGRQMTGQMLAFDKHMNLVLADTEEFRKSRKRTAAKPSAPGAAAEAASTTYQEEKRTLGLVILRGTNIVSCSVEGPPPSDPSARLGTSAPGGQAPAALQPGVGISRPAGRGLPVGLGGPAAGIGGPPPPGGFGFPPPGMPGGPPGSGGRGGGVHRLGWADLRQALEDHRPQVDLGSRLRGCQAARQDLVGEEDRRVVDRLQDSSLRKGSVVDKEGAFRRRLVLVGDEGDDAFDWMNSESASIEILMRKYRASSCWAEPDEAAGESRAHDGNYELLRIGLRMRLSSGLPKPCPGATKIGRRCKGHDTDQLQKWDGRGTGPPEAGREYGAHCRQVYESAEDRNR